VGDPTAAEHVAPRSLPPEGRSLPSTIAVWFAAAVALTSLALGAGLGTNTALPSQVSHTEAAEEAGSGEETAAADRFRSRAHVRRSRHRPRIHIAQRWTSRAASWVAPLVVPTSFAPRRGPPLLTV
jgi:hypothetical protein